MESYEKGETRELEMENSEILKLVQPDVVVMKVHSGSKIRNLINYALKKFQNPSFMQIIWTGHGSAITKVISSVEIIKRQIQGLHQVTNLGYKKVEETWKPKMEGLESLIVTRNIPLITILLSKNPLDPNILGYSAPKKIKSKSTSESSTSRKKLHNKEIVVNKT
ncbi:hypothetical protein HELRODRAFT_190410 [Helobdella robusta]|uniref:DNA/RNA-binding protein Alba-like domain-containing protein n=1 Tax=Helobdella robusta TaxID=6412 RepID=T1FRZ0_HELRO|nr:hypothetical protein HELRODRAFT_190410 [Helobdella robusta]ESO10210.1 hypothetical protein HELRODRAFT_190410 [Helobdella robusta]